MSPNGNFGRIAIAIERRLSARKSKKHENPTPPGKLQAAAVRSNQTHLRTSTLASPAVTAIDRHMTARKIRTHKRASWSQYLATAANAFDHAVKCRVLAIDWIVRITHQFLLRGHLIGPRLAVADRCLPQQLLVLGRRWGW